MITDTARPAGLAWIRLPSPIVLLRPRLDTADDREDAMSALVAPLRVPGFKAVLAVGEPVAHGRFEATSR